MLVKLNIGRIFIIFAKGDGRGGVAQEAMREVHDKGGGHSDQVSGHCGQRNHQNHLSLGQ